MTHSSRVVTATEASWAGHIRWANSIGASATRFAASRLVRLETGSSRLAVLASQTVVIASGSGATLILNARARMTGVRSTAVVSRLSAMVVAEASTTHSRNSAGNRPRAMIDSRVA